MEPLIEFICLQNDVFIKNQQRDEPSLKLKEKKQIVSELFEKSPSTFVYRYSKYLTEDQLKVVRKEVSDDNTVVLKQIDDFLLEKKRMAKHNDVVIKNRRMAAVEGLLKDDKYFSFYEMQSRHPYLFEKYIGKHMNRDEKNDFKLKCDQQNYQQCNWSSYLLEQIRLGELRNRFFIEEQFEEGYQEDEDDNEQNEEDDEDENEPKDTEENDKEDNGEDSKKKKDRLIRDFMFIMIQNFIDGKDYEYFDYSQVDNNDQYDMSKEYERDLEDKYFDE